MVGLFVLVILIQIHSWAKLLYALLAVTEVVKLGYSQTIFEGNSSDIFQAITSTSSTGS